MWGEILKRDLLGESREEDKFHSKEELKEYIESEIQRQGKNVVIRDLDVSLVEDLSYLFSCCSLFGEYYDIESLDLSGWKTSNVKFMNYIFSDCKKLKSLNLSGWDISNVKYMHYMFGSCESLEDLNLSGWDTSNDKFMNYIFSGCPSPYIRVRNNNKITAYTDDYSLSL